MTRPYCCVLAEEQGLTPQQHAPFCDLVDADLGESMGDPGDGSLFDLPDQSQQGGPLL